ncbi:phage tail sheath family protein [Streptomyces hiroshimensis]|uniref:Tail protein n=1 Tax=Streptomyces hiroshimensis TaxID=66424 RepID=A0ABQ2ZBG6_9ACTN|nr:phage tail sheath C-terminal domain-containing protein [Streptomyces hiroshimensis]GGY07262.1 tail protein [Streptomyces hiroshimensis]
MPVKISYPGVYIDEVKSSVRTITGVPTSIAAFVGWAPRGPADEPVHITSWADYETQFGGLHPDSPMSYAVEQFYRNGGAEAEIVRVVKHPAPDAKAPVLPIGKKPKSGTDTRPTLVPVGPGAWAQNLTARVEGVEDEDGKGDKKGVYNLRLTDTGTGVEETYLNVSTDPDSPRSLRRVVAVSQLVRYDKDGSKPPEKNDDEPPKGDHQAEGEDQPSKDLFSKVDPVPKDEFPALIDYEGDEAKKTGLQALLKADIFNILCIPDATERLKDAQQSQHLMQTAVGFCHDHRAVLLVDPPNAWNQTSPSEVAKAARTLPITGDDARNAAIYYPRVLATDLARGGLVKDFPPCGVMAGVLARTDAQRGVWKAPAGTDASLNAVQGLMTPLTDLENGRLNQLGVNCLRELPAVGPVAWGARTMRGNDQLTDEWKYLPVRRLALFLEESLFRGTQWVVFEPNDEPLWASIRLNIGAFMNSLFREGAFQGRTPAEAYLVKCDRENNPQNDIDRGIVNIQVGFAPLKPAEFVIIHIQQLAGQVQV